MTTPDHRKQPPTPPSPISRVLLVRAAVTGAVSATTRVLLTWLLAHHPLG